MASLRIPDRYKAALLKLAKLTPDTWKQLHSALEKTDPVLDPDVLVRSLASKVGGLTQEELEPIVVVLLSLTIVRASRNEPAAQFVESAVSALRRTSPAGKGLSGEEERNLRDRLADALKLDRTLGLAAKARDVIGEIERSFCDSRILTDIRPVFTEKVTEQPSAAVIVHTLKVAFHVVGELREFYIAMDTRDLKRLRSQIERAEEKGTTLRTFLKKSGIAYLDAE